MRIVITGPPKAGKSALAKILSDVLGFPVHSTDALVHETIEWSQASEAVSHWFDIEGPWIIEGVTVPRALRKWKLQFSGLVERPFDRFVFIRTPKVPLQFPGQRSMAKGVQTVAEELKPWIGEKWVEL